MSASRKTHQAKRASMLSAYLRKALRPETVLVSVMHANNELGTVQPIAEIAALAHEAGALMHSDGVQALGKLPAAPGSLAEANNVIGRTQMGGAPTSPAPLQGIPRK